MAKLFGGRRAAAVRPVSREADTVIGAASSFSGVLKSDGNLYIDGLVEGAIECAGRVTVGPGGRVLARITAQEMLVAGMVEGDVWVANMLRIAATGKLWGDIVVGALFIDDGGLFRGQLVLRGEADDV